MCLLQNVLNAVSSNIVCVVFASMKLQKITNAPDGVGDGADCPEYGKLYFVFGWM